MKPKKLNKAFALILAVCLCITTAVPAFAAQRWTVVYDVNGADKPGNLPEDKNVYDSDNRTVTLPHIHKWVSDGKLDPDDRPSKTGYAWVGWSLIEDANGKDIIEGHKYTIPDNTPDGPITFYAQWGKTYAATVNVKYGGLSIPGADVGIVDDPKSEVGFHAEESSEKPGTYIGRITDKAYGQYHLYVNKQGFEHYEEPVEFDMENPQDISVIATLKPQNPDMPTFAIEGAKLGSLEFKEADDSHYDIIFGVKSEEGKTVKSVTAKTEDSTDAVAVTEDKEAGTYTIRADLKKKYTAVVEWDETEVNEPDADAPEITANLTGYDEDESGFDGEPEITKNEDGTYKVSFKPNIPEGYISTGSVSVNNVSDLDVDAEGVYSFTAQAKTKYTVTISVKKAETVMIDETLKTETGITEVQTSESDIKDIQKEFGGDAKLQVSTSEKTENEISEDIGKLNDLLPSSDPDFDDNTSGDDDTQSIPGYSAFVKAMGTFIEKILTNSAVAVDISIHVGGSPATKTHNGSVNIQMNVPSKLQGAKNILAIHYHNNERRIVPVHRIGSKLNFTLQGLSDVVLVEYTPGESVSKPSTPSGNDNRYVAYNPSSNRGSGSGSSGGSTGSNAGIFSPVTSTINSILKAQLSKGIVGAASTVTSTATAAISSPATQAAATRALSQAISQAHTNGSNNAQITMRNISVVSASILQALASDAQKSGMNAYLSVDTMKNGVVDVRVQIPVSAASRLGRDVNMASIDNTAVKTHFNRYYSNRLDVVALAQNGSFGVPASVAARLSLPNAKAADLHFYSFNPATNSYQEMPQTDAFFDVNGYLHFNTEAGGYIIVSDGTLKRK